MASRKAGELIRFYKTDGSTVMVAMDGESLIAFVDDIGNYFYDTTSAMANMKSGKWHHYFYSGEHLPVKTEGKLTSCYPLTDEENFFCFALPDHLSPHLEFLHFFPHQLLYIPTDHDIHSSPR